MVATSDPGASGPLPRAFYDRPTRVVARALLGCRFLHETEAGGLVGRIVETEAYVARDPANHAFGGPTERNRSMFAAPGTLYVYRIHQVHCANAVTRPGEAVLLRAAEPLSGGLGNASGPGRLCRAFGLTRRDDGLDLTVDEVRILARDRPLGGRVLVGPRVGISKAVEAPLRYAIAENRYVSSPRPRGRRDA